MQQNNSLESRPLDIVTRIVPPYYVTFEYIVFSMLRLLLRWYFEYNVLLVLHLLRKWHFQYNVPTHSAAKI